MMSVEQVSHFANQTCCYIIKVEASIREKVLLQTRTPMTAYFTLRHLLPGPLCFNIEFPHNQLRELVSNE